MFYKLLPRIYKLIFYICKTRMLLFNLWKCKYYTKVYCKIIIDFHLVSNKKISKQLKTLKIYKQYLGLFKVLILQQESHKIGFKRKYIIRNWLRWKILILFLYLFWWIFICQILDWELFMMKNNIFRGLD